MKISTKGRYGLRALVDLASHENAGTVSLLHVAKRQNISLNYLEQVFAALRKAGIVKSQKGAQGGYRLSKSPEEIRLGDVLTVLEGKFNIIEETDVGVRQDAVRWAIQELVWDRINASIWKFMETCTLAELVEQYKELGSSAEYMYYI